MHGTEQCKRKRRTFRLSAPQQPLSTAAGSMLRNPPLAVFRSGPDARSGLSLACNGCSLRSLHSRVNVPGLLLRFPADCFHRPFGIRLHNRARFAPDPGRFFASRPLRLPQPARSIALPASTPLRDFYLPPDQSVRRDSQSFGPPSEPARSPFAPRSRFLSLVIQATDQRSRSATFPEVCCSSNLLEPLSLCRERFFSSTNFATAGGGFLNFYRAVFRTGYGACALNPLWIKRAARGLLRSRCRRRYQVSFRIIPLSVASQRFRSSTPEITTWLASAR
jgi:hypothetical protein